MPFEWLNAQWFRSFADGEEQARALLREDCLYSIAFNGRQRKYPDLDPSKVAAWAAEVAPLAEADLYEKAQRGTLRWKDADPFIEAAAGAVKRAGYERYRLAKSCVSLQLAMGENGQTVGDRVPAPCPHTSAPEHSGVRWLSLMLPRVENRCGKFLGKNLVSAEARETLEGILLFTKSKVAASIPAPECFLPEHLQLISGLLDAIGPAEHHVLRRIRERLPADALAVLDSFSQRRVLSIQETCTLVDGVNKVLDSPTLFRGHIRCGNLRPHFCVNLVRSLRAANATISFPLPPISHADLAACSLRKLFRLADPESLGAGLKYHKSTGKPFFKHISCSEFCCDYLQISVWAFNKRVDRLRDLLEDADARLFLRLQGLGLLGRPAWRSVSDIFFRKNYVRRGSAPNPVTKFSICANLLVLL